jgi:hypothetical protein
MTKKAKPIPLPKRGGSFILQKGGDLKQVAGPAMNASSIAADTTSTTEPEAK